LVGSSGYFLTVNYVPDVVSQYESVDYLQKEISFGYTYQSGLWYFGGFVLLGAGYAAIRGAVMNKRSAKKK
jgi:hypothetical protein